MSVVKVERTFGIIAPQGDRISFQKAATRAELEEKLLIGYKIVNELVDGVTVPPLPDGLKRYSFMTSLLMNHSLELREWLAENGCVCRCGQASADTIVGVAIDRDRRHRAYRPLEGLRALSSRIAATACDLR